MPKSRAPFFVTVFTTAADGHGGRHDGTPQIPPGDSRPLKNQRNFAARRITPGFSNASRAHQLQTTTRRVRTAREFQWRKPHRVAIVVARGEAR